MEEDVLRIAGRRPVDDSGVNPFPVGVRNVVKFEFGEDWREQIGKQEMIGKYILYGNDGQKYLWLEF